MASWYSPGFPEEPASYPPENENDHEFHVPMSLTVATLIPGLLLLALGGLLLIGGTVISSSIKALPRSTAAAVLLFGAGAIWFLYNIWHLSEADFGQYRGPLFIFFALVAGASFFLVPDFLAVRGLAVLILLGAMPLLDAAYMEFQYPQRLFMVTAVFVAVSLAIYLGASPFRLRDFIEWLYRRPARPRMLGGALAAYGLLLCGVAFTY
ncbi:hypothetical protein MASR2M8_20180 [Opitutaceae bacterium]